MTLRTQIAPYLTPVRVLLTICLLIFSTTAFDCEPLPMDPGFTGGIRVITKEALLGIPNSDFRVPGIPNSGILTTVLGTGTGNQTDFAGPTNANGIRDWPQARTNATWTFHANYVVLTPRCGTATFPGIFVPSIGLVVEWTCYL